MIKILIADGMEENSLKTLKNMKVHVVEDHYDSEELKEKIKEFNVIVVRSATKIRKEHIDEAVKTNNLKLIIRGGVGLDNIDVDYAIEKGIAVRNTPNASSVSVAELVIGHIFTLARFLHNANITMRKGEWNKKQYEGIEIEGKTLGIIGFGRIGKVLANKADALGMNIQFYDVMGPFSNDEPYDYYMMDDLLKTSDFISVHIPYDKGVEAFIGKREIMKMKDGVYVINSARGGVVDEEALLEGLNSGKIAGAAIDVFVDEPNPNPLLCTHHKVSVTPHIGASTIEAQRKIGEEIIDIIEEFWKGREHHD